MVGKVKWFDVQKGHGFIEVEGGNDVYINTRNIEEGRTYTGLNSGDEVEFETVNTRRGVMATGVKLVPTDESATDEA